MRRIPKTISEQEFLEGIKKVKKPKIKLAFILGFYQCMRISEIAGLRKGLSKCCRADIKKEVISKIPPRKTIYSCAKCNNEFGGSDIRRSKIEWQIYPLTKENIDINRGFIHLKNAKGSKDRDIPIMKPVINGLRYLPIGIGIRALEKQIKKYWKTLHFHCLRHSGATYYLHDKKVDIRIIQQLLGHSRLDSTQIYTHVNPIQMKNRFDELW